MTLRSVAFRVTLAAAAGLSTVALAAGPAAAASPQTAPSAQIDDAAGGSREAAQPKAKKYCILHTVTGSRMQKKSCRTAEEWKADGIDVTKPD